MSKSDRVIGSNPDTLSCNRSSCIELLVRKTGRLIRIRKSFFRPKKSASRWHNIVFFQSATNYWRKFFFLFQISGWLNMLLNFILRWLVVPETPRFHWSSHKDTDTWLVVFTETLRRGRLPWRRRRNWRRRRCPWGRRQLGGSQRMDAIATPVGWARA